MKCVITESQMVRLLSKVLTIEFGGVDDLWFDWANYNCGMGECCDPYAISFHLPRYDYYEVFFKYVDSSKYDYNGDYPKELSGELPEPCHEFPDVKDPRFDMIVVPYDVSDEINKFLGSSEHWKNEFLSLMNEKYNLNAKHILVFGWD